MSIKTIQSKVGRNKRAWSSKDVSDLVYTMNTSYSLAEGFRDYSKQTGRTVVSIRKKWDIIKAAKPKKFKKDVEKVKPLFIPEKTVNTCFLEQVEVTMYKGLDGSLHKELKDLYKSNVRTIIDSLPDYTESDDKALHQWFTSNKDKVEYLLETNINIWN